jgi:hypothetical protein
MGKTSVMNILFIGLLGLACLFLVGQVANLLSMPGGDAFSRGMSQSVGILLSIGLWVLLIALLVMARTRGPFPFFSGWAVFLAVPASFAAMFVAVNLFEAGFRGWWLVVPVGIPALLVALFTVAVWFPRFRSHVEPLGVNYGIWGSILLLTAIPWLCRLRESQVQADREKTLKIQEESEKQERRDRFARLSSDSPLAEWLEFAAWGSDVRDQALTNIRQLPRRQANAEAMLAHDEGVILEMLPYINLEVTPTLCQHAQALICKYVATFAGPQENQNSLPLGVHRLERFDRALELLCQRGGNVSQALDCIENFALKHPDTPERANFLGRVKKLRQAGKQ